MIFKSKTIENSFVLMKKNETFEKTICLIKESKSKNIKQNSFVAEKQSEEVFFSQNILINNKESKNLIRVFKMLEKIKKHKFINKIYIKNVKDIEYNNNLEIKSYRINKKELLYNSLFCLNNKNKEIEKINFISLFKNKNIFELKNNFKIKNKNKNIILLNKKNFGFFIDLKIKNINIQILKDEIIVNFEKLEYFNEYEIYYYENNEFVFLESFEFEKNKIIKTNKKIFSIIPKGVY